MHNANKSPAFEWVPCFLVDADRLQVIDTETGDRAPIECLHDEYGAVSCLSEALAATAGPFPLGWLSLDLSEALIVRLH